MKTKKTYISPEANKIEIDNEISLVLTTPPSGPGEGKSMQYYDDEDEDDYYYDNY
jgi:hypothetical protein